MQKHDKAKTEETGSDVGDKHGPVVKSRLREVVLPTLGAVFVLLKGPVKREGACGKKVSSAALGAAQAKDGREKRRQGRMIKQEIPTYQQGRLSWHKGTDLGGAGIGLTEVGMFPAN